MKGHGQGRNRGGADGGGDRDGHILYDPILSGIDSPPGGDLLARNPLQDSQVFENSLIDDQNNIIDGRGEQNRDNGQNQCPHDPAVGADRPRLLSCHATEKAG